MTDNYQCFMEMDLSGYTGEWVAVDKSKVVAHGKDFSKVLKKTKQITKRRPFIARVPEKATMIF